jgi:hypothetical protein
MPSPARGITPYQDEIMPSGLDACTVEPRPYKPEDRNWATETTARGDTVALNDRGH